MCHLSSWKIILLVLQDICSSSHTWKWIYCSYSSGLVCPGVWQGDDLVVRDREEMLAVEFSIGWYVVSSLQMV